MTRLPDLGRLSTARKVDLIRALWAQAQELCAENARLSERVRELEARLGAPPKDAKNSSVPPSRSRKANTPDKPKGARRERSRGRRGGGRRLDPDPDQTVLAKLKTCPECRMAIPDTQHRLHAAYDRIELPPVRPVVTRVEQYAARCSGCGTNAVAPVPTGLQPGSPYGGSVAALALYLRYVHAISYQRLSALFRHLFGLDLSEGALANLFRRTKPRFDDQVAAILARLRSSRLVCSDETSARVQGRTTWEWVFQNDQVCVHVIRPSRARRVVEEVMAGHRPQIWVSDLYGAQRDNAADWQVCLAHQLRDCQYAIEAGDTVFAPRMKRLIVRACALGRRRDRLKDSTLKQYRYDLDRRLDACLARRPTNPHGRRLQRRYLKLRGHLFTFMTERDVPTTNNGSERDLRPSTTFRKVTNGFRSDWGADLYAGVRSVLNTARRQSLSPLQAIQRTLEGTVIFNPG